MRRRGRGSRTYGVKFSLDGAWVSLAVCLRPADGPPHVEVIEQKSMDAGKAWLVDWLVARHKGVVEIVIDGKSDSGDLKQALRNQGVPEPVLHLVKVDEVIAASSMLFEAVKTGTLTHFNQQPLDRAAQVAAKRPIGTSGGWGWQSTVPDVDVSPLDAITLAHFGAVTSKRKPGRKAKAML
jgi:hypothetical protein